MTTRPSQPDLESIRKLTSDADVEGLIEIHGAPANEYDKEAEALHAVIVQLQTSEITVSKLLSTLEAIWRKNFIDADKELALRRPALQNLAEQLVNLFGPTAKPKAREDSQLLNDLEYLRAAIAEARAAERDGEVPIGAVIVHNGEIIARGQNRVLRDHDPTAHAEIVALRHAGRAMENYRLVDRGRKDWDTKDGDKIDGGCTLYTTLEPCAMCAGAIIHARINRLVYAAPDPKAGACGSVLGVLNHPQLNHRVAVTSGLLAEECGALLTDFFRARRQAASE